MNFTYTNLSDRQIAWFQSGISGFGIENPKFSKGYPINEIPVEVTVTVVSEPSCPGHKDAMCTHGLTPDAATIEIRQGLDDPENPVNTTFESDPNPTESVKDFWLECVVHELAHVATFYLIDDDDLKTAVADCFVMQDVTGEGIRTGALEDWNPSDKPWEERIQEAVAEVLKDHYFAGRVFDNRTKWTVKKNSWITFMQLLLPEFGPDVARVSLETIPESLAVAYTSWAGVEAHDGVIGGDVYKYFGWMPALLFSKSWTLQPLPGVTGVWGVPRAELYITLPRYLMEWSIVQSPSDSSWHQQSTFDAVGYLEFFKNATYAQLKSGFIDLSKDLAVVGDALSGDPVLTSPFGVGGLDAVDTDQLREQIFDNPAEMNADRVAGRTINFARNWTVPRDDLTIGFDPSTATLAETPEAGEWFAFMDAGGTDPRYREFPQDAEAAFPGATVDYVLDDEYLYGFSNAYPGFLVLPDALNPYIDSNALQVSLTLRVMPIWGRGDGGVSMGEVMSALKSANRYDYSGTPESVFYPNFPFDGDYIPSGYELDAWHLDLVNGLPPEIPEREESGITVGDGDPGVIRLGP